MKLTSMIAGLVLLGCFAAAPAQARVVDGIAAVVGEEIITLSEVREVAGPQTALAAMERDPVARQAKLQRAWRDALDALIAEKLLSQQVTKLKVEVTDSEVDAVIQDIMKRNNVDEETLKTMLQRQGMTWETYKRDLKKQLTRMRVVEYKVKSQVDISEEDIQNYYVHNYTSPRRSGELKLRRIVLNLSRQPSPEEVDAARKRAQRVRARVLSGEDFGLVAQEVSDGPGAAGGGELGWLKPGEMLPAFEEAVRELPVGGVSEPVRTPGGLNLLQVMERRRAEVPPLDKVRPQIQNILYQQKVEQQLSRWVETLKGDTYIDIKVSALREASGAKGRK